AATGRALWTHEAGAEVWASPLQADDKVWFATRRGDVLVFAATREKRLLDRIPLGEPISSSPVAANGTVYIATMKRLYASASGARPGKTDSAGQPE
ncbi:MAG: PQQ-binding-like beta-propeller repeat protein, partial [Alteraurantiacibacter sp.]|nr:PQQ-binding-like beta-propeller repeat protein [Alteraurantiacibacter sp.]